MGSGLSARSALAAAAAVALSGVAFYLSDGLQPRWWAAWVAALPILWVAPRLSLPAAALAALAARLIGGLSMWAYHTSLRLPLPLQMAALIVPALAFCAAAMVFRMFLRRGQLPFAALAFPAVMIAYEYLVSLAAGTFGATGYTQLKNLPVLQLGSLTGLWGIGFIVMLFPSMIAAIALSAGLARRRLAIAFALVFGCTLVYGVARLEAAPSSPQTVAVGLVASDLPKNILPQEDRDAMRLLSDYAEQVKPLAARGAHIVVLPEMTALVRDSISGRVDELFRQTAREQRVQIVAGILHATSTAVFNEARLYSGSGSPEVVYRKHHLVPVFEGRTTPGNSITAIAGPIGAIGLQICRDMDYANPSRRYGKAGVGLVLAPAWDFDVDRLWHGHMSIMRGVENGYSIVRAAKQGYLTVSDDRGRVLAETPTTPREPFTTLVATAPVRHDTTLYQTWGDWFAWLDLALVAALLIAAVTKRPTAA